MWIRISHTNFIIYRGWTDKISIFRWHNDITRQILNKYVRLRDWRISTHANPMSTCSTCLIGMWVTKKPRASHYNKGALADSPDFGLLGSTKFTKMGDPCLGRRQIAVQNLTPLALSSAEKSVTVQTNKKTNKHTNKQ